MSARVPSYRPPPAQAQAQPAHAQAQAHAQPPLRCEVLELLDRTGGGLVVCVTPPVNASTRLT
ncbi:MAG: hypothetical protein AB8I80_04195, partial [Anaerolineae bacterium]